MAGRPSIFSPEIASEICSRIAAGESLRRICLSESMPAPSTVCDWVLANLNGFSEQYARARRLQAEGLADELFDISDDGSNDWMEVNSESGSIGYRVNGEALGRSRLRVDTRKWYLSKVLPKIYGEKVTTEHSGVDGKPIETVTRIELVPLGGDE